MLYTIGGLYTPLLFTLCWHVLLKLWLISLIERNDTKCFALVNNEWTVSAVGSILQDKGAFFLQQ